MKTVTVNSNQLRRIFERQVSVLLKYGYDYLALDDDRHLQDSQRIDDQKIFLKSLEALGKRLANLKAVSVAEGNVPLLIVVSRSVVPISQQMRKVFLKDLHGISEIRDYERFRAPSQPVYLIFNVDIGPKLSHFNLYGTKHVFNASQRAGLLIEEGIALVTHYRNILSDKSLYLIGSMEEKPVPMLTWGNEFGEPVLVIMHGSSEKYTSIPSRDISFDMT